MLHHVGIVCRAPAASPDADGDGIADTAPPTDKAQCRYGGWANFNNPSFRNQGKCVSYVTGGEGTRRPPHPPIKKGTT